MSIGYLNIVQFVWLLSGLSSVLLMGQLTAIKSVWFWIAAGMTKADVGQTFQHVGEMDTLRFMCTTAAQFDLMLMQTDIDKAFLQAESPSVMHAYPPEGMKPPIDSNGRRQILEVTGNIYGKLDAPRVYGRCYDDHIMKFPKVDGEGNRTVLNCGTADYSTWHFLRQWSDGKVSRLGLLVYIEDTLSMFDRPR